METASPDGSDEGMSLHNPYSENYYKRIGAGAESAAAVVAPLIVDLVQPNSVVDVGCGLGQWLKTFQRLGVERVLGIEGAHIQRSKLMIPDDQCVTHDLREPLHLAGRFDLVLSLEVAEHLPPRCAATFVSSLVSLGPIVLFSAAIPFQGGNCHLNEQWPQYWAALFRDRGYVAVDVMRPLLWVNESVPAYYAQNMFLYVEKNVLCKNPALQRAEEQAWREPLALVHPDIYAAAADPTRLALRRAVMVLPIVLREFARCRLRALRPSY
jgi:SAM-dependent methyltransferase